MDSDSRFELGVTEQFELYFATDAEGLYDALGKDDSLDDVYAPAYGVSYSVVDRCGVNSFESSTDVLSYTVATDSVSNPDDDIVFCWHRGVIDMLEEYDDWFGKESLYDKDERGPIKTIYHDFPIDVSLETTGGISIVIDYATNPYTADDYMVRVQLFYGVPWDSETEQYPTVTIHSKHIPESINEVFGVIGMAFEHNPVDDINLCLDEGHGDDDTDSNHVE